MELAVLVILVAFVVVDGIGLVIAAIALSVSKYHG